MTEVRRPLLALLVMTVACAPGEAGDAASERTDAVTESLLSSSAPSGNMSELPTGSLPPGRPVAPRREEDRVIDVALLGVNHGDPDALVRVVEFSDFGCGYCRQFHQQTWSMLQEEFVEPGKVEWKFLPFVSGMFRNSPVAAEGAECVLEQGRDAYEAMSGLLWEHQSEWKGSGDPETVVAGYAEQVGVDMDRWASCVEEDRRAERLGAADALARQLGVRGTPTFFVVGYPPLQGALPPETFRQVLDLVYEDAARRSGG